MQKRTFFRALLFINLFHLTPAPIYFIFRSFLLLRINNETIKNKNKIIQEKNKIIR